jgi:hypothetical protein
MNFIKNIYKGFWIYRLLYSFGKNKIKTLLRNKKNIKLK